jgi:hypothetical protein
MRIGYRTNDEVNRHAIECLASALGAEFHALEPWTIPKRGQFDLLIYDFDYLPREECDSLVQALVAGPAPCRVVVHGFNLDFLQRRALSDLGVAVLRHLVPSLFRKVRLAR